MKAVSLLNGLLATTTFAQSSDTTETLLLWQILKNGGSMQTQQAINPYLMAELFGKNENSDKVQKMLLLNSFSNPDMNDWLPFVLTKDNLDMKDKLLMMQFMQQQEKQGLSSMSEMYPILMLADDRFCTLANGDVCTCTASKSDTILKIMLLTGGSFASNSPQTNLFYMLFNDNDDGCACKTDAGAADVCPSSDTSGIDPMMMYFMMNAVPTQLNTLPAAPPARSVGVQQLLMSNMAGLPSEFSWLMNVEDNDNRQELMKLQLFQQMGIPPALIELLEKKRSGTKLSPGDRYSMLRWLNPSQMESMTPEQTALMIGAEDAKQFYISSLLQSGQIPEITGILLMALAESTPIETIKEVLIQVAAGQLNPEAFSIINKPYVPELPMGVYPGQELYFVHLHMLSLDTCAMHDVKNRYPCAKNQWGGKGPLNADQCEISPYCCWNPIYVTDEQAAGMLKRSDTDTTAYKASDIPWCYYNVFFIFHDEYYLQVARPVELNKLDADFRPDGTDFDGIKAERWNTAFAPPAECPGLFKYGLKLDPIIYARANTNALSTKLQTVINKRTDCGFPGIPKFQCVAIRGCCFDDNAANYNPAYKIPQCYKKIELIPASVFKIMDAPAELQAVPGECNTNFFKVPQLYYQREPCNYGIEMYTKSFGDAGNKTPLDMPTPEDCIYKLGCCWEDDEEVLLKYKWTPRCYKRQRDLRDGSVVDTPLNIKITDLVARAVELGDA